MSRSATREATRIYQVIGNNHASFHLRLKGNWLNQQKISKYYEHDCRQQLRVKIKMRWLIGFVCLIQFFRIREGGEF